jgi:hypothetical protein
MNSSEETHGLYQFLEKSGSQYVSLLARVVPEVLEASIVKQTDPTTNSTASSWTSPLVCKALKEARRLPTAVRGTRVLT